MNKTNIAIDKKKEINMKKILLLSLLSMSSYSLYAGESDAYFDNGCKQFLDMASSIMKQKQAGIAESKLLQSNATRYKDHPNDEMRQLVDYVIRDAYAQPTYAKPMSQETQLNQFANKYYVSCLSKLD